MFVCVNRTAKHISVLIIYLFYILTFSILNYKILIYFKFTLLSNIIAGGFMCYFTTKSSLFSLYMNTTIVTASQSVQLSSWCLHEEIHSRIKEMSVIFFFITTSSEITFYGIHIVC